MAASQLFQNMRESARFLLLANKSNVSACMNAIQPYSKFKPFQHRDIQQQQQQQRDMN